MYRTLVNTSLLELSQLAVELAPICSPELPLCVDFVAFVALQRVRLISQQDLDSIPLFARVDMRLLF